MSTNINPRMVKIGELQTYF